jgi:hypothetical protein
MGRMPKGAVDGDETDNKWDAPVDPAGTDRKAIRREEKRKRKEERKFMRDSRKKRKTEGERT